MTKKEPKEKRIADIIQAAVNEFLEKGYENASMEAIASRSGMSKGGLYHHFNSKEEILLAANHKLSEPVYTMMGEANQQTSARKGLVQFIKNYLLFWNTHQKELVFFFLSMTKVLDNPELSQSYAQYVDMNISFYQDLYQRGIEAGEFIPHSSYASAVTLMGALDGIVGYPLMNKKLKLLDLVAIFTDKFINSVAKDNRNRKK